MKPFVAALAGLLLAACSTPSPTPARFSPADCHTIALTDQATGQPIVGAEDLALSDDGKWLLISAYNRLAVESALKTKAPLPNGGLYTVDLAQLEATTLTLPPLIDPADTGGLRPHGIALGGNQLAVINRRAGDAGDQAAIDIFTIGEDGIRRSRYLEGKTWCAANDLSWQREALVVSRDRQTCPGWSFGERVLGQKRATLLRVSFPPPQPELDIVADKLFFANGVVALENGDIITAETRGKRLRVITSDGATRQIKAPGAPDNLTISEDGVIAALQPNLIRFGRYRYGHANRAPSRIALWSEEAGWETLYEDKRGQQFPGATVGVLVDDMLVAGSIRAPGLLVCTKGAGE